MPRFRKCNFFGINAGTQSLNIYCLAKQKPLCFIFTPWFHKNTVKRNVCEVRELETSVIKVLQAKCPKEQPRPSLGEKEK